MADPEVANFLKKIDELRNSREEENGVIMDDP